MQSFESRKSEANKERSIEAVKNSSGGGEKGLLYRLGIICICFFVALLVAGGMGIWLAGFFEPDSRDGLLVISLAQNIVGFALAAFVAAWIISRKPCSFLGLSEKVGFKPFIGVIIFYIVALPFLNQLVYYNEHLHLPDSMSNVEQSLKDMENAASGISEILLAPTSIGSLISGILIIGIITGFSEELLFRGALQRALEAYNPMKQWSVWIAAIIFSAAHMQFFGFFPRVLLGAFFGYILYSSGSIWPGIFAHALNNSLVVFTEWYSRRYGSLIISDNFGVSEEGFPVWACISFAATIVLIITSWRYFFSSNDLENPS